MLIKVVLIIVKIFFIKLMKTSECITNLHNT